MRVADDLIQLGREKRRRGRPSGSNSSLENTKKKKKPCVSHPYKEIRFDSVGHFPVYKEVPERGRCRLCIKGITCVTCVKCSVQLCFTSSRNCFHDYHQKNEL